MYVNSACQVGKSGCNFDRDDRCWGGVSDTFGDWTKCLRCGSTLGNFDICKLFGLQACSQRFLVLKKMNSCLWVSLG